MISKLSRTNEQHRQEEGLHINQGEDEGDAERRGELGNGEGGEGASEEEFRRGASEEEFNQHLSVFPELLLDSQVFGIFRFPRQNLLPNIANQRMINFLNTLVANLVFNFGKNDG